MAYYSDPTFIANLQALRAPGQTFGGPFAATRNAVAQRLQGRANTSLTNQIAQQGADFRRNQAEFQGKQAWSDWGNRIQRAATDLAAREKLNYDRRVAYEQAMAAYRARKGNRIVNTLQGSMQGATAGFAVGGPWGAVAGGALGGAAGYASS